MSEFQVHTEQSAPADSVPALERAKRRPQALNRFTLSLVQRRGWLSESELGAFLSAGFTRAQVLELILGLALKTLSNYSNHITDTPRDPFFRDASCNHPQEATAAARGAER